MQENVTDSPYPDLLDDESLLSLIIGSKRAKKDRCKEHEEPLNLEALLATDPAEISYRYELTQHQAKKLWAVGELYRRAIRPKPNQVTTIKSPEDVDRTMRPLIAFRDVETLWVLALNTKSCLIGTPIQVSQGCMSQTDCSINVIGRVLLRRGAKSAILCHNHPSGDPTPSKADLEVNRKISYGLSHIDIQLQDHLVIASSGHVSIKRSYPSYF